MPNLSSLVSQSSRVVTANDPVTLTNKTIEFGNNTLVSVASTDDNQTLTNKTITFGDNTLTDVASTNTSQTLTNKTIEDPILDGATFTAEINEAFTTVTSSSGATIIDCTDGNNFAHTLTEGTTFSFTNAPAAGVAYAFTLEIVQDSGGSGYTVTWPSSVVFPDATAPTLSSAADAIDIFVFYTNDGGTTWYGFIAGQAMG